jgi:hypothetical protein
VAALVIGSRSGTDQTDGGGLEIGHWVEDREEKEEQRMATICATWIT